VLSGGSSFHSLAKEKNMFEKIESILQRKAPLILEAFQSAAEQSKIEQLESLVGIEGSVQLFIN
jgi:hypothetical protein